MLKTLSKAPYLRSLYSSADTLSGTDDKGFPSPVSSEKSLQKEIDLVV